MKILLADDEIRIHTVVERICEDDGYEIINAYDGQEALEVFEQEKPDLVILDVMMPRLDGFKVCKKLREQGVRVPVLFLSAKGDIVDKGIGFDAGGDDYLVKPFSPEELSMRIKAHLRRQQRNSDATAHDVIEYENLKLDIKKRKLYKNEKLIELTPKEFDILAMLACNRGEIFTRDQLTVEVWGEDYAGETLGIAVYIRRIREKIEDDPSKPSYLQTVWREGYRFGD